MKCRFLAPLLVSAALVSVPAGAAVDESWMEVQEALSAEGAVSLAEPIGDLVQSAEEIDVRRMTSQASALVAWSQSHPEAGDEVLEAAIQLDPELPSARFTLAGRSWRSGAWLDGVLGYVQGCRALLEFEVTRRHIVWSVGIWLVIGFGIASVVAMVVLTLATIRRSIHDAMAVGGMVFERANAVVFGLVLLLLPLLAGLGPTWLLVYLFALGWICLDHVQRVIAVATCVVLALLPAALESLQRALLTVPPVTERVAVALDERQLDPSALREFLELEEVFQDDSAYHLILGELFRMHSALESAKVEFQTAALEPLGDSRPFVILGNMALEDGDAQLAIQHYDEAIATDGRTALAYHNLSSAYDLVRRFQQGDIARARARELAGGRSGSLGVRGRDPRVRYPSITSEDVNELIRGLTPEQRLEAGLRTAPWRSLRQLLSPISMSFWVTGLFGLILLAIRVAWFPAAHECGKCGKVYRLEDEPGESVVYCRQCVSVFLQRDLVPIDQQAAKLVQVRRWDRLSTGVRRLAALIAPGGYQLAAGQIVLGVGIGLAVWIGVAGAAIWAPRFLAVIEPTMSVLPVIVVLALIAFGAWSASVVASWQRR